MQTQCSSSRIEAEPVVVEVIEVGEVGEVAVDVVVVCYVEWGKASRDPNVGIKVELYRGISMACEIIVRSGEVRSLCKVASNIFSLSQRTTSMILESEQISFHYPILLVHGEMTWHSDEVIVVVAKERKHALRNRTTSFIAQSSPQQTAMSRIPFQIFFFPWGGGPFESGNTKHRSGITFLLISTRTTTKM